MTTEKQWTFAYTGERAQEVVFGAAAASAYGLILSQVFNPAGLGVAAAYGVAKTAHMYYSYSRKNAIASWEKKGYVKPLPPEYQHFQDTVDEIAAATGQPKTKAMLATIEITKMVTPWYVRPLLKIPELRELSLKTTAAAVSVMGMVMATPEFLDAQSAKSTHFVMAHEMSHTKVNDSYNAKNLVKNVKKHMHRALVAGVCLSAAASIAGIAMPALFTTGAVTALATWLAGSIAANIGINYVSRIMERRADRNAIYITRDVDAGIEFLNTTNYKGKIPGRKPALFEVSQHPSYHPRIANLREAFKLASAYPALSTALPQVVAAPAPRKPGTAAP